MRENLLKTWTDEELLAEVDKQTDPQRIALLMTEMDLRGLKLK